MTAGTVAAGALVASLALAARATILGRAELLERVARLSPPAPEGLGASRRSRGGPRSTLGAWRAASLSVRALVAGSAAGLVCLAIGGPLFAAVGAVAGGAAPYVLAGRAARERGSLLERQFAETAESLALAVRSGLAVPRAIEFAATEVPDPMGRLLRGVVDARALGVPFERAMEELGSTLGTEDARLFVLVVTVNHRHGGNVAAALDEVSATVRHRMAVRRELRALTAQGRLSGTILGALPLAFFLVLLLTSRHDLGPVLGSAAGLAMVCAGLTLEALAFLWIRHILRVTV